MKEVLNVHTHHPSFGLTFFFFFFFWGHLDVVTKQVCDLKENSEMKKGKNALP
jgi:hypothetical protein